MNCGRFKSTQHALDRRSERGIQAKWVDLCKSKGTRTNVQDGCPTKPWKHKYMYHGLHVVADPKTGVTITAFWASADEENISKCMNWFKRMCAERGPSKHTQKEKRKKGLDKATSMITVISMALYDTSRKRTIEEFCFNVCLTREESLDNEKDLKLKVRTIMNGADALVAYNGISFDLPFLAHWIDNLNMDMLSAWKQKTVDFLHEAKIRIHSYISLDHVASLNQITMSKIATGKQAIVWAQEKKWDLLQEYCNADVAVLLEIFKVAQAGGLKMQGKPRPFQMDSAQKKVVLTVTESLKVTGDNDKPDISSEGTPAVEINPSQQDLEDIFDD